MENFDANAGTNKLANVLSDRMRREMIHRYAWTLEKSRETAASLQTLSL